MRILSLGRLLSLGLLVGALSGCGEKTSTKTEKTVTTPGGSTTVTTEQEVKHTGDNPPPASK